MAEILNYTELSEIDAKISISRNYFQQNRKELANQKNVRSADNKQRQFWLKKLYWSVKDHEEQILEALEKDFHRSRQESISLEYVKLLGDILHLIEGIPKWNKPKKVRDNSAPFMFGNINIEKISRGNVLVISPFNFPVLLALAPVACALSAGNTVILKPSEMTPHCALVLEDIVKSCQLPEGVLQIVQGGVEQTTKLINSESLDMIFYTGSPRVGSIVAQAAAKNLVPCVLELGGKSPTFITGSLQKKNLETALKRIFFGAFGNAGQICVSPDYLLVHESIYDDVVKESGKVMKELYPDLNEHTEYTHMIHKASYDKTLIDHILARLRSGDCIICDTTIHVGIKDAPFGGIGQSGYGNYGGVYGFDAFSHERIVLKQPFWVDFLLKLRYPPFTAKKVKLLKLATERQPWFDREGNDHRSYKLIAMFSVTCALLAVGVKSFFV
ncbi:Aldehyde dehydrogenases glutamic acid active site [Nakaseomyces glabratus]